MEGSEENYGKKEIVAHPASLTHFDQQVDCTKSGRLPSLSSLREPFFFSSLWSVGRLVASRSYCITVVVYVFGGCLRRCASGVGFRCCGELFFNHYSN